MKTIKYLSSLLFILCIVLNCSSETPQQKTDNSATVKTDSGVRDTLYIVGNNIWVRDIPETGKVIFKLSEGDMCFVLEKGKEQVIRGNKDYWYKIEHKGKTGWVYGSQSSIKQKASPDNFEYFLEYFIQTCYSGKNIDSLLYANSAVVSRFIHKEVGFYRLYNPGAACVPFGYNFYKTEHNSYFGHKQPVISNPVFYKEQLPDEGFCNGSGSPEGIYYKTVDKLPDYPDLTEDFAIKEISVPSEYKNNLKVVVNILSEGWISKTMYFIIADDKWWLVLINDCDCSA